MLTFVGLGLWDARDVSVKGFETVREADEVYVEFYTSKLVSSIDEMEEFFGKKIIELERSDLEENSHMLIERAKNKNVVLLVPGDPMVATTHSALRLEAERSGVRTRIIHGASIISAVCGLTGLHNYRFGKSATVSWHKSETPVKVVNANRSIDAHTLLFLDLHPEPMTIKQAVKQLISMDDSMKDVYAVGIARAGSDDSLIKCDKLETLKNIDFGKPLHVIVVLAKTLHFMEFECLREFADAPPELERLVA
ncbi:diphthine synthase [Archaeoglobus sp.]